MRTNVVLDDDLINEAIKLSGIKTKKDVISCALREFVATRKRCNLLELAGKNDKITVVCADSVNNCRLKDFALKRVSLSNYLLRDAKLE